MVKLNTSHVKSRSTTSTENSTLSEDTGASDYAVVRRRNKKSSAGQKNRKSSVLHESSEDSREGNVATLNETNIRLISVKPQSGESSTESVEGGVRKYASGEKVETRVGKMSSLVDQFIEEEEERTEEDAGVSSGKWKEETGRKISANTLQKFEKTGKIMGIVSNTK